ncbi:hypothetical protein [Paenibacillus sp. OAE614]|uniref:hypothetical protein n=1 Tax=Paenibacillus sp. OAE614 TaxID=2663804 RepID=UPI00178AEF3E
MKFGWRRESSRAACISATVTRSILKSIDVEVALELSLPMYALNPESISKIEHKRLVRESHKELLKVKERAVRAVPAANGG